jgi:preprotein translocase subunit SecA
MEQQNHEIRKNVLKYDEVMNKQRTVIYEERRKILHGEDLSPQVTTMIEDVVTEYVQAATADGYAEEWDLDKLWTALKTLYPITLTTDEAIEQAGGHKADLTYEGLLTELLADARAAYAQREEDLGPEVLRELERRVLLSVLDRKWREHLYEMDYLQEGIGLRAMAQRDPLVEYQREGFDMFATMMDSIKEEAVGFLFNLEVEVEADEPTPAASVGVQPQLDLSRLAAAESDEEPAAAEPDAAPVRLLKAKGLQREQASRPLLFSGPEAGTDEPTVRAENSAAAGTNSNSNTAKRQAARSNPNRGNRGNKPRKRR